MNWKMHQKREKKEMKVGIILWVIILGIIEMRVNGRFIVEKNSITVVQPYSMKSKQDGSIANFGVPQYGGSLLGTVVYPPSSPQACKPFHGDNPFKSNTSLPTILLLDRGECYFALKAWNAQVAGAAAVLVADSIDEPLITMDSPEESSAADDFVEKLEIPSVLIKREFGDSIKKALKNGEQVVVKIDWSESMPNPDGRVEYELWSNGNDECGVRCDEQINFIKDFKGRAQILEKSGYTLFTPHYITWYCPESFLLSQQCKSQCINNGRYCAPDPDQDFMEGYEGKDVVLENLRQLCVHKVAKEANKSWVWWDYVTDFHIRCSMKDNKYTKTCAQHVLKSLDLAVDKIEKCMGNPEADVDNEVLKNEQDKQVGQGSRGDVTILPTLVINDVQYRGKLEETGVLKAICAGFEEKTEPPICLTKGIETDECIENNGGCWFDVHANISACKDTFRGRVCECPLVNGVQYQGDGYTSCTAQGPGRCSINNGGCWSESKDDKFYTACSVTEVNGCKCPEGFTGDGHNCEDIDECKEGNVCQCPDCKCKNTWGGYDCNCGRGHLYMKEQDSCIERSPSKLKWFISLWVLVVVGTAGLAAYIFYKYRFRSYMDSEIMAIMSQYMPIDSQSSRNGVDPLENEPLQRL